MKTKEPVDDIIGVPGAFVTGMFMTGVLAIPGGAIALFVLLIVYAAFSIGSYDFFTTALLGSFAIAHLWMNNRYARYFGAMCRSVSMTYALGFGAMTTWLILALVLLIAGNRAEALIPVVYGTIVGALSQYTSSIGMRNPTWSIDNICPICGYPLENLPEPGCPECGHDRAGAADSKQSR